MERSFFCCLAMIFFLFTYSTGANAAATYPTREIQLIIPNPPGGYVDIAVRLMVEDLGKSLGVPIVVSNRAGSGGAVGTQYLVKSKPDGYTIGCVSSADFVLLPALIPAVPFKPSDLVPLCQYVVSVTVVFCRSESPWKSVKDLVEDARKRPEQITYGATTNSVSHIQTEGFLRDAGIKMTHVPLQAAGQTITRVLGGNLDIGVSALAPLVGQLKAGSVRALFVGTSQRIPAFPQTPTLKEAGFRDPIHIPCAGFFAPVGVAEPIRETLGKTLEKRIKDPALERKLEEAGLILEYLPAQSFAKRINEDYKRVADFVTRAVPQK